MKRPPYLLLAAFSVLALAISIYGGIRHDYGDYLKQWALVLGGEDPWGTNSAYGPLHNAFALLVPIHYLGPKLLTTAIFLAANALLVLSLWATRPLEEWRATYLVTFGANVLVLVCAVWFGLNDAFVAALVLGAVVARHDRRMLLAGVLLGLATLDKYYPALLIPFFAMDARRFEPRLVLVAALTIALGLVVAIWLWGSDWFEAIAYGVSRDAAILSPLRPIVALGRWFGYRDAFDLLVRFNSPLVLLVWLGAIAIAWVRRENWLMGACWGFFAVLLTYKAGNPQFWVTWLALVAALPLLRLPEADRLARLSWPYAIFLDIFQIGYVLLRPQFYQGQWLWVNDVAGIPSFVLGVTMLWLYFRRRVPRPAP